MTHTQLIDHFERMWRENWRYEWGSAETGKVDCAGAFVWAYRQHGKSIYHGSNRIQRTEILEMLPIDRWEPGMAAFKRRMPGDRLYALPDGYKPGGKHHNGDLADYYHIGLVGYDGKVLNAQSKNTGFVKSKLDNSWCGVARLKQATYEEKESGQMATIKTADGKPVNLRGDPSTKNAYLYKLASGAAVEVLEKAINDSGEEWAKVKAGGKIGYVMAQYLSGADEKTDDGLLSEVNRKLDEVLAILKGDQT
jgi:hypothetical protein